MFHDKIILAAHWIRNSYSIYFIRFRFLLSLFMKVIFQAGLSVYDYDQAARAKILVFQSLCWCNNVRELHLGFNAIAIRISSCLT